MRVHKENLYLKSVLEGIGNSEIPIHELSGFDHGGAGWPGRILMMQYINKVGCQKFSQFLYS